MASTTEDPVERLLRLLNESPDAAEHARLARLALEASNDVATIPHEKLAPQVARIVRALCTWFALHGDDAVVRRVNAVLAGLDPKLLATALVSAAGELGEAERKRHLRDLDGLALGCPALFPALDALAVRGPIEDPEVARFLPYVNALFAVAAKRTRLGSLDAYKAAVRARMRSPRALDDDHALAWAALDMDHAVDIELELARTSSVKLPNLDIHGLYVNVEKVLVEVVRDPNTEIDLARLRELQPEWELDNAELGHVFGLPDPARTRALRSAALHVLGL